MINDLNRWTVGWIDWNLLLDEQGGPNHVGNFCSAPFLADRPRTGCTRRARMRQWATSRASSARVPSACCARPRARRWSARPSPTPTAAWRWWCSTAASDDIAFSLAIDGVSHATDLPAHAIATYVQTPGLR
jgi:glucosylceramidase